MPIDHAADIASWASRIRSFRRRWPSIAGARLVAAVGEAGGFGILGGGYGDKAWLEQETAKLQASRKRRSASASSPGAWRSSRNCSTSR